MVRAVPVKPRLLFLLLASNRRPRLHLALALEGLESIAPVFRELGAWRGPALSGSGWYENRLLLCRARLATVGAIERACKRLERWLAPRREPCDCPLDLDPFLLVDDGCARAFARTGKVLDLLARLDPEARLGFDRALASLGDLKWR